MGPCLSTAAASSASADQPTAKIVTIDGSLIEYSVPVNVSQVLGSNSISCLLCNSDGLCYGDYVRALPHDGKVEPGKLYFMLPIQKRDGVLSGPDMAALAVKAVSAVEKKMGRRRELVQAVLPMNREGDGLDDYIAINECSVGKSSLNLVTSKNHGRIAPSNLSREKLGRIEEAG